MGSANALAPPPPLEAMPFEACPSKPALRSLPFEACPSKPALRSLPFEACPSKPALRSLPFETVPLETSPSESSQLPAGEADCDFAARRAARSVHPRPTPPRKTFKSAMTPPTHPLPTPRSQLLPTETAHQIAPPRFPLPTARSGHRRERKRRVHRAPLARWPRGQDEGEARASGRQKTHTIHTRHTPTRPEGAWVWAQPQCVADAADTPVCTRRCGEGEPACPMDWTCDLVEGRAVCVPPIATEEGCSVASVGARAPSRNPWALGAMAWVFALSLLGARRRRRTEDERC
jgi:hypothetical protein